MMHALFRLSNDNGMKKNGQKVSMSCKLMLGKINFYEMTIFRNATQLNFESPLDTLIRCDIAKDVSLNCCKPNNGEHHDTQYAVDMFSKKS